MIKCSGDANCLFEHSLQSMPNFFFQLFLLILSCSLVANARAQRQTIVFNYEAASGQLCKISDTPQVSDVQPVNLTLGWHSASGQLPELTLCNLTITREFSELMVIASDPQRAGCYLLKPLSPKGYLTLRGVILPEVFPKHFINLTETLSDWRISVEIEKISSATQLQFSPQQVSGKGWATRVNETGQIPFDIPVTAPKPGLNGLGISGGFRHHPFYPPGGPWPGSLSHMIVLVPPMLEHDGGEAGIQPRYLIKIHIQDQDTLYIGLTGQDWQNLLAEGRLSTAGIMAFLRQRISQQQLQQDQRQELEDLLDRQDLDETAPVADKYIQYLLEQLSTPVVLDIMPVSHQHLPEILTLGNVPSKSSSGSAPAKSAQATGTSSSSSTSSWGSAKKTIRQTVGSGGQPPPPEDTGLPATSQPAAELDLVEVFRNIQGAIMLNHQKWSMLLHAFGCLSYEELLNLHSNCILVPELLETYLPRLKDLQGKLIFLQVFYEELQADTAYKEVIKRLFIAVPKEFRKQLTQPISLHIGKPEDSEQALESLLRFLAGTLFQSKWVYWLKGLLKCESALDCFKQCRANGLEGFRRLYADPVLKRLFDTYLPNAFIQWLQGGAAPWPNPELPRIDEVEHVFNMPGINRLNFWKDLALNAYANSAITFHQFQDLVTSKEGRQFGTVKAIAAMLDSRRANRFLSTLQNLLKVQNPRLMELIKQQSSNELQAVMSRQLELLPMPEDAGEADDWRRALAAALSTTTDVGFLKFFRVSLYSSFIVENNCDENSSPIELKVNLLLEVTPPASERGRIHDLLRRCIRKQPIQDEYDRALAQIRRSDPHFLAVWKSERGTTKRKLLEEAGSEEGDVEYPCPVCMESMKNIPTGICFTCRNGICLPCARKICRGHRGRCPACRAENLQIARDFEEEEKK